MRTICLPSRSNTFLIALGCCFAAVLETAAQPLADRFPPPTGYQRATATPGTFAHHLRHLRLHPTGTPVLLHSGQPKYRQDVHAAVVDMPTGTKDLQQCADAIIRLRAVYLRSNGREGDIAFDLTNGFRVPWERWAKGDRVKVAGNTCTWTTTGRPDGSDAQFERYLEFVFTYAGTRSLERELVSAASLPLEAGDVFIQGGSPGHAMVVLDVAHGPNGRSAFLLGQSYMPAQDFHVVRNTAKPGHGAWFILDEGAQLATPEWTFAWTERKRWPERAR